MKKLLFLFVITLLLWSCNDKDEKLIELRSKGANSSNIFFSFDSITNPTIWSSFQTLEEMQSACQIPNKILKSIPTDSLIKVCMNYPLFGNYLAYNNELDGINAVMNGFNGFTELKNREDAADRLIAYYENMNIENIEKKVKTKSPAESTFSVLHIGYIELILSSNLIPTLYIEPNISRLEQAVQEKYECKLRSADVYSINSVKKSLLLGSKIKLKSNNGNKEDNVVLSRFVQMGGNVNSLEDYTIVSKIINK